MKTEQPIRFNYTCIMKGLFFFILSILFVFGCRNSEQKNDATDEKVDTLFSNHTLPVQPNPETNPYAFAVDFINDYLAYLASDPSASPQDFINSNAYSSESLKQEFARIKAEAEKADPEIGLDFDPIVDAQDYPNDGFEFDSMDTTQEYITVKGKTWKDFKVTIKIINNDGTMWVDGIGVLNIPPDKQAKR